MHAFNYRFMDFKIPAVIAVGAVTEDIFPPPSKNQRVPMAKK